MGREQRAHVAGDAGYSEQTRLLVEQLFDRSRIQLQFVHQIQDHTRIQTAAACAHRQSVHGGEGHRAGDASASVNSTHAGAVAQVQNHRAASGCARVDLREDGSDVLVGEAMETITAYAPLRDFQG